MVYLLAIALMILPFAKGLPQVEIGVITFNVYMATILLAAVVCLLQNGSMIKRYQVRSTELAIIALGIAYLISTLNAPNILDAGYLAFHALFIPFASFYVIKSVVVSDRDYKIVFTGFLASILVFGVFELVVVLQTMQRPMPFKMPPIGGATLLMVSTLFLLFFKRVRRLLRLPLLGLSLMALFATLTRVYLVYLLVAGVVHKRIRGGKGLSLIFLFIAGTLLATLLLIEFSQLLGEQVAIDREGKKGLERLVNLDFWVYALQGRANSYLEGLANFKEHILFGVGLYRGEVNITRHNFHIEWLEYGGLVGYLLYAAVFLAHFSRVSKMAVTDSYIAINLTILLGILLNSVTNGFMHGVMPYVAFIIMGFSEARLTMQNGAESKTDVRMEGAGNKSSGNRILRRKSKSNQESVRFNPTDSPRD